MVTIISCSSPFKKLQGFKEQKVAKTLQSNAKSDLGITFCWDSNMQPVEKIINLVAT